MHKVLCLNEIELVMIDEDAVYTLVTVFGKTDWGLLAKNLVY